MKLPNRICATVIILTSFAVTSSASTSKQQALTQRANTLFAQEGYPLLFVGRIAEVNSTTLPCTVQNQRPVVFHVDSVLSGFAPPTTLKVFYPSCGGMEPEFSARGNLLVLVICRVSGICSGLKQLMLPATPQNMNWAQSVIKADLREKIARFLQTNSPSHNNVLIFKGTLRGPIPRLGAIPCKVAVNFPVHFEVNQVLQGDWTNKDVIIGFGPCAGLPDWLQEGQSMIVFSTVNRWPAEVYGDLNFLFPLTQFDQVNAALMLHHQHKTNFSSTTH